jgi:hypothetical protein
LSKDNYGKTAWHNAARVGHVEVLEKLWEWAKELQLKPEELRNQLLLSKDILKMAIGESHIEELEKCGIGLKECS